MLAAIVFFIIVPFILLFVIYSLVLMYLNNKALEKFYNEGLSRIHELTNEMNNYLETLKEKRK